MIFNNKKTAFARATQIISRRQHPVSAGRSSQIRRKFRSGRRSRNTERDSQRPEIAGITNDFFAESGKHYVTVILKAGVVNGRPQVTEPEKCKARLWFNLSGLPENLFPPMRNFLAGQRSEAPLQV